MLPLTLACGPFFRGDGVYASLIVFVVVLPPAYFAFIQAFRYRVSRPIPMRFSQAAKLAAARAGLGLAIIGVSAMVLISLKNDMLWSFSWVVLCAECLFSWWLVGSVGAGLVGRRLLGWVISGTLMNIAFAFSMVASLFAGWMGPAIVTFVIGVFIWILHYVGRRPELRRRFPTGATCTGCGYDLTGNLSGRCPECGQLIQTEPVPAPA